MTLSTLFTGKTVPVWVACMVFLSACSAARDHADRPRTDMGKAVEIMVAVLPVENLSGAPGPLKKIRESLAGELKARGFRVLEEKILEEFMAGQRMRHLGGIDGATARALMELTEAGAVLISSLELYDGTMPPKISLTSRLVSTADPPTILWMDNVGLAGDDSPGLLDLGVIEDPNILMKKAIGALADSLEGSLRERSRGYAVGKTSKKFQPRAYYRSSTFDPAPPRTLAVLPFLEQGLRKHSGRIMMLHIVREMTRLENVSVVEPGVVRKELLNYRIILDDGISLANADVVLSGLNADLLVAGKTLDYMDYNGYEGAPLVDFSIVMIERKSREAVWSSRSRNNGTDGVYFFDIGKERTASSMASEMARVVGERMWKQ